MEQDVQKLMEIINQKDRDIKRLINLLEQLAEKRLDLKFQYDGGTHCTICGEIYSNLDILDRQTLENCSHQAHRQCIYKNIKSNIVCCRNDDCLQAEKFWSHEWMQGIKDQEELKNKVPQIQQPQRQPIILKCEDCRKALIEADPISLGSCDHFYCKQCCISIIQGYKIMECYQQNQLVCPSSSCQQPISDNVIQITNQEYWSFIQSQRRKFDRLQQVEQMELLDQNEQLQQYQQIEQIEQFEQQREQQLKRNQICVAGNHLLNDIERSVTNTSCQHMYCKEHFNELIAEYQYFNKFQESEVVCIKCQQPLDLQVIDNNDTNYFATIMQLRFAQN